eukprot:CAMPEP_0116087154 /NCGR_PEP_ID=MMETSP0327-20121206/5220_1 /TAXON_ID=44447 /ORGANISM="Pseudo-nitzschia delicatissima, Strain B596" /LENGTH=610 /DNA_ID=CAMNT_0003578219 /DNA_START=367 /DNA_END=2199 /DNA_ORIENTATION=+
MTADTTPLEAKETATITNRLFLSHIDYKIYDEENNESSETDRSPEEVRQKLEEIFSKFGSVLEIYLSGKEDPGKINDKDQDRPPFAFIAMETAQEAQAALDGIDSQQKQLLFRDVAPAHVHKSKKNKQNKNERLRSQRIKEYRDRSAAISTANVICQVHSSHLDRLQEFALSKNGVSLVSSFSAQKGTSLLFLKVEGSPADESDYDHLERFSRSLWDTWFVAPNLNRITLLNESKMVANDKVNSHRVEGNIRKGVVPAIFRSLSEVESDKISLRLAIFPPKLQRALLEGLEEYNQARKDDENDCCKNMDIQFSPGNPTHSISIVQVHPGVVVTSKSKGDNEKSLYSLGRLEEVLQTRKRSLSEDSNTTGDNKYRFQQQRTSQVPQLAHNSNLKAISITTTPQDGNDSVTEDDKSISRAYWKLQEAWERYKYETPSLERLGKDTMWALDCGAAPGGWTKFLFRPGVVDRIYAVDPGKLANEVAHGLDEANKSESPIVRHVDKTIQKALPGLAAELREEKSGKFLDIWVSDMCVKDMNGQIDCFLQARDEGVVGPGTFFVLTLKCILGYSATAFDQQTEEQVKRLESISRDIHVVHLFSNRSSERTVIGYLI